MAAKNKPINSHVIVSESSLFDAKWTASNSFSIKDAALTLKIRGKAMQNSVGKNKGSMAAILGLNIDQIIEIITKKSIQNHPKRLCKKVPFFFKKINKPRGIANIAKIE